MNCPPSSLNMLLSRRTRRREFITAVGAAGVALPITARAQQSKIPVVACINAGTADSAPDRVAAFRMGLSESGYIESKCHD